MRSFCLAGAAATAVDMLYSRLSGLTQHMTSSNPTAFWGWSSYNHTSQSNPWPSEHLTMRMHSAISDLTSLIVMISRTVI